MSEEVDVLVASFNGLPWLKLQMKQMERLKSPLKVNVIVDNSGLTQDGTLEWLQKTGVRHIQSPAGRGHSVALRSLLRESRAPYVAFMDVDTIPIKEGWLDEVVAGLDRKILLAGLFGYSHRPFVHSSFVVFRREDFDRLNLNPDITRVDGVLYDTCAYMSHVVEALGFGLRYFGHARYRPDMISAWTFRAYHFQGSSDLVSLKELSESSFKKYGVGQKSVLTFFGLWDEFIGYARESYNLNPLMERYEAL